MRRIVSGIISVIRTGLRCHDAPAQYGPHKTIYNRIIRWSRLGAFNKNFAALLQIPDDWTLYRQRHRVENMFSELKD